jgi:hypothetical protein|tara:strand:- start:1829 stop:1981 length:153 start_codon:yes stop_codon:yes gene_type:complete
MEYFVEYIEADKHWIVRKSMADTVIDIKRFVSRDQAESFVEDLIEKELRD